MKTKPKYLFDRDPWMLAEEIPDSDIFFFQIPMSCFVSDTSYPFLKNYKRVLTHYKKFHMDFYFSERDSFEVGEIILNAMLTRPRFGRELNRNIVKWSRRLMTFAKAIKKLPLADYTNKKLWALYAEHDHIHTKLYTYGWLPVGLDMFHNNFTNKLKQYLYSVCDSKEAAENAFFVFTAPTKKTIVAEERGEFLNIYQKFRHKLKKPDLELKKFLDAHTEKWRHLGYIYAGNVEPLTSKYFLDEMRELARSRVDGNGLLRREARQLQKAKAKQQALYRKLKISPKNRQLFQDAGNFALTKLFRRHSQLFTLQSLHTSLIPEIAKRLNLTRYQVQFMLKGEVRDALLLGQLDKNLLRQRMKECVLYTEKGFEKIYTGAAAKKITKNLGRVFDGTKNELTGQTAQPGYARGPVKIIIRAKDIKKMKRGDILVSIATDPDVVPAMKIAGAIVTEQGGITSHAAIVSRELGIPCVIGTKIATKIFKDGDMVEVDANKGIVRKI